MDGYDTNTANERVFSVHTIDETSNCSSCFTLWQMEGSRSWRGRTSFVYPRPLYLLWGSETLIWLLGFLVSSFYHSRVWRDEGFGCKQISSFSCSCALDHSLSLSLSLCVQRRVLESEGCAYVPGFHVVFVGSLEKWHLFHQISLEELHRGFRRKRERGG